MNTVLNSMNKVLVFGYILNINACIFGGVMRCAVVELWQQKINMCHRGTDKGTLNEENYTKTINPFLNIPYYSELNLSFMFISY